eukprot:gene4870-5019_t
MSRPRFSDRLWRRKRKEEMKKERMHRIFVHKRAEEHARKKERQVQKVDLMASRREGWTDEQWQAHYVECRAVTKDRIQDKKARMARWREYLVTSVKLAGGAAAGSGPPERRL